MPGVAAATALHDAPPHGSLTRPSMVSIGTIVWLSSELMFFAALFAMFFTTRSINQPSGLWDERSAELNIPLSATFTAILVASSVTCQLGVFAAEKGDVFGLRRWFAITLLMGTVFVTGQMFEYTQLVHEGLKINSDPYGSVFYLTTGFHALHVTGGLIAFIVVLARSRFGRFTPEKATSAIVTSYYWHFVDVVWIALFVAIYVLK